MSEAATLHEVIEDELFPQVDLWLRSGRHVDQDDFAAYAWLCHGQAVLETFYRRFGWELIRSGEGYFYLRPVHARLRRRRLGMAEMLVGQALAYLFLDPVTVESAGVVSRPQVFEILVNLVGEEKLKLALFPRRRRRDQRTEDLQVRQEFDRALRHLYALGFIDLVDEGIRLRAPLMRFAEVVKGLDDPRAALERLIARGDVEEPESDEEEEA
jgi:chromosome partition protein MukE